ncbi:MAG: Ig-like domain-containing protein [bacterium]
MHNAIANDYNTADAYANFPDEYDGLGVYTGTFNDARYWNFIQEVTHRSISQFAAGYRDGRLPFYHIGPVYGEGGMDETDARKLLGFIKEQDPACKMTFWNGIGAGAFADKRDDVFTFYYSSTYSASTALGYLNNGWHIVNAGWNPTYFQFYNQMAVYTNFSTFRVGEESAGPSDCSADGYRSLIDGACGCTWEMPNAAAHLGLCRTNLAAMSDHLWRYEPWPYAANAYSDFTNRWTVTDGIVERLIKPDWPTFPVAVSASDGVYSNRIVISWNAVDGATKYRVFRNTAPSTLGATGISGDLVETQYTDSENVSGGVTYYYMVCAGNVNGWSVFSPWDTAYAVSTRVTNLADGTIVRHPLVLVDGAYDGETFQITAMPTNAAVSFTATGNRFRCLVDLQPGTNTLTLTDNHDSVDFHLVFVRPTATNHHFKVWYVVPSDEVSSPVDTNWFVHFGLQSKVMQSWMAEDQLRAGNGRATFYPELDTSNNVNVGLLVLSQTRAQAEALGGGAVYGQVWNQIPAAYKDGSHKNLAFTSVAPAALGGGDLAYVGAYTNIFPDRAADIMAALLSTKACGFDSLTFATYSGVTLHEVIHCIHSIWHDFSPNNIMGGAYDISQYFTLTYNAGNPTPHNESSAATLGNPRDLAAWNRYLMSADPHVYSNTAVGVTAGPEYLTATSRYPLAVFQYYIPSSAVDLHTNLAAAATTVFRKHAGRARQELGSAPFNIMAVDTEGNMSYTSFSGSSTVPVVPMDDSYAVIANRATLIVAPGVFGNDINPSGSTLTALLASNAVNGVVSLGANGGFTYTPTPGFMGTDTFWYTACDAVSSDQQAHVTLIVSPAAVITSTTNGVAPLVVTFADPSTGTITNRYWGFGDGTWTNASATSIVHAYTNAGVYSVTLVASGPAGVSSNTWDNLIVVYGLFANTLPYQITFEPPEMQVGDSLFVPWHLNGWYGDPTGLAYVTNQQYAWLDTSYPVPTATHSNVLAYQNAVFSNLFTHVSAPALTIVDLMIRPGYYETMPDTNTLAGVQLPLFVDTNGHLNAWCSGDQNHTNRIWMTYANAPIGVTNWARLTVAFDYTSDQSNGLAYTRLALNGVVLPIPGGLGYACSEGRFVRSPDGNWLVSAIPTARQLNSLTIAGVGYLDDLVVTDEVKRRPHTVLLIR